MSDCVVLSDSDESVLSIENDRVKKLSERNGEKYCLDSDSNNFEFPKVCFCRTAIEDHVPDLCSNSDKNGPDKFNIESFQSGNTFCTPLYETCDKFEFPIAGKNSRRDNVDKSSYCMFARCDSTQDSDEGRKQKEGRKDVTSVARKAKSQVTEDRSERREQLMREKALQRIALKKWKNIKPGECMKFIEVVFDNGIQKFAFITDTTTMLLDANIQYSIKTQLIPNSITWRRSVENSYVNRANEICTVTDIEKLDETLIVWNWDEAIKKVADGSFRATISNIQSLLANNNLMLVIVGIDDYFAHREQTKGSVKNKGRNKVQKNNRKSSDEFQNFPDISREEFEVCLNEIQIISKCSSRLVNGSQDLALVVYQYTKAIAEIPYKLEKNKSLSSKFDWYVMGDNRNTVSVDKDGNGLKRLWQQQLCQFNLSSLEIAEAICSVYPSPADLTEAYSSCTQNEAINLLKDIPIRRAAGPLTTTRKVGPELSKKIYTMFTSKDSENVLN